MASLIVTTIAVLLAVFGNFLNAVGFVVEKLGHRDNFRRNFGKPVSEQKAYIKNKIWLLGIVIYGSGSLIIAGAFSFGPQSLLVPMESVTLVSNVYLSYRFLGESLRHRDLIGTAVILVGILLVVLFGPRSAADESDTTAPSLTARYLRPAFVALGCLLSALTLLAYILIQSVLLLLSERKVDVLRVSIGGMPSATQQLEDELSRTHSVCLSPKPIKSPRTMRPFFGAPKLQPLDTDFQKETKMEKDVDFLKRNPNNEEENDEENGDENDDENDEDVSDLNGDLRHDVTESVTLTDTGTVIDSVVIGRSEVLSQSVDGNLSVVSGMHSTVASTSVISMSIVDEMEASERHTATASTLPLSAPLPHSTSPMPHSSTSPLQPSANGSFLDDANEENEEEKGQKDKESEYYKSTEIIKTQSMKETITQITGENEVGNRWRSRSFISDLPLVGARILHALDEVSDESLAALLLLCLCFLASVSSSWNQLWTKSCSEVASSSFAGEWKRNWYHPYAYLLPLLVVSATVTTEYWRQRALKSFGAMHVVPIVQVVMVVGGTVLGAVYFQELDTLIWWRLLVFVKGILLTVVGIFIISWPSQRLDHFSMWHLDTGTGNGKELPIDELDVLDGKLEIEDVTQKRTDGGHLMVDSISEFHSQL